MGRFILPLLRPPDYRQIERLLRTTLVSQTAVQQRFKYPWHAMESGKATTKSTGGGGFTFADKVAAGFLARMLRRDFFLGPDLGPITDINFETKESGNPLDDLEITFRHEQQATRLLLSVKSNRQITKAGFDSEFVADAWRQVTTLQARTAFDPEHDLVGLTVGFIDELALEEWKTLQGQGIDTTPQRLLDRLVPEGQSSVTQRAIFDSLRLTDTDAQRDATETARLVAKIRVFPFSERNEHEHINLCAEIVADGSLTNAGNLWGRLVQVASESRGTGAHFDLPKLLRKLRPDFELRDYPDYEADWGKLEALSIENLHDEVRTSLGKEIHLARVQAKADLSADIEKNDITVVSGESGSGKSALLSEIAAPGTVYKRMLWLTAGQLAKPSQIEAARALNLRHPIPELIAGSARRHCLLVVDGFEQFEGNARKNLIRILKELHEQKFEYWKIVFTCQPQTLDTLRDTLFDAGVAEFTKVDFEKPKLDEVLAATQGMIGVQTLLLRKELQPILRNLMVLDWVIREDVAFRIPASRPWIGETEIIDVIWSRWVGSDTKKFARDGLLRLVGQKEGERLTGAVHIDSIPLDQRELLGELEHGGLLRIDGGSVRFFHDLMGDWARYRTIKLAQSGAAAQIKEVVRIPRWGRGIRLYGQSLAEEAAGLDRWRSLASELAGDDSDATLAGDFLLDGLLFAPNSELILEQVWPDLIADKAQILQRLLKRLLYVASVPDRRFEGLGNPKLAESTKAWFRIPHPLYWYPVLRVLAQHSEEIVELLPDLGAEVCALWLRTMPQGTFGRSEASALAVSLAKELQGRHAAGLRIDKKSQTIFEALLYAAPDRPDEVQQMALELSGRRPEPCHAIEWAAGEYERQQARMRAWQEKYPDEDAGRRVPIPGFTSYRLTSVVPPQPQGPQRDVPDAFRAAVLDTPALNGLEAVHPEAAKEVLLAVLIQEPGEISRNDEMSVFHREQLGLADWPGGSPAMPWKGSFLRFLESASRTGSRRDRSIGQLRDLEVAAECGRTQSKRGATSRVFTLVRC